MELQLCLWLYGPEVSPMKWDYSSAAAVIQQFCGLYFLLDLKVQCLKLVHLSKVAPKT